MNGVPIRAEYSHEVFCTLVPLDDERSQEQERVNDVVLEVLGYLKYFWYSFLYMIWTICSESDKTIFKDSLVLLPTHNYAKKEDLKAYATLKPINIKEFTPAVENLGFSTESEEIVLTPCDWGKCMGGVVHFLHKTSKEGAEKAAEEFKGGMPVQAVFYQAIYNQYDKEISSDEVVNFLIYAIEHRHVISENKLKEYWNAHFDDRFSVILDEIKVYLIEGNDLEKGGFTQAIENRLRAKGLLLGHFYGSIRKVEEHLTGNKKQVEFDDSRFIFQVAGLNIEPICIDESPHSVVQALSVLEPGSYYLSLSGYNPIGILSGKHATALVINPDRTFYFLEPNFAVGLQQENQLQVTIERTFTVYTGVSTFGQNPGKAQVFLNRFKNFITLGPNASHDLNSGFSIYRVMEANP